MLVSLSHGGGGASSSSFVVCYFGLLILARAQAPFVIGRFEPMNAKMRGDVLEPAGFFLFFFCAKVQMLAGLNRGKNLDEVFCSN